MSCKLNEKTNRCSKTGTKTSLLCDLNTETGRCYKRKTIKIIVKKQITAKKNTGKNKTKKIQVKKPQEKKPQNKDRKHLCVLPPNMEYVSQLGQRGKDGETWKIKNNETDTYYALKIFDKKKSRKNIDIEIDNQNKLKSHDVAPKIIWTPKEQNCFMMELVDGESLTEYTKHTLTYTHDDVKQLYNIIIALTTSQVGYNDGNVKMNMMRSKLGKWKLIDYGMIISEKSAKQQAKKQGITIDDYYLINAFNIVLKVEEFIMKRKYGKDYKYTPIGGVFKPSKSYPSLMKYVYEHGLEDKISLLRINKKTFYGPHKKYDIEKRIGV